MWLNCMRDAMQQLNYSNELSDYLLTQLAQPAELIRKTSQAQIAKTK